MLNKIIELENISEDEENEENSNYDRYNGASPREADNHNRGSINNNSLLDITAEEHHVDKSQSMFVQPRAFFNKGGDNHIINASQHKNSETENVDGISGSNIDGEENKDDDTSPSQRNYERMMLNDDEMKPHSMFVKGVKFGGLKKAKETRYDQNGNLIAKKSKQFHITFVDDISK